MIVNKHLYPSIFSSDTKEPLYFDRKLLKNVDDECGIVYAKQIDNIVICQLQQSVNYSYHSFLNFDSKPFKDSKVVVFNQKENTLEVDFEIDSTIDIADVYIDEDIYIKGNINSYDYSSGVILRVHGKEVVNIKYTELFEISEPELIYNHYFTNRENNKVEVNSETVSITGGNSISSQIDESVYIRRLNEDRFDYTVTMLSKSNNFQQMAGILLRYDLNNQIYFYSSMYDKLKINVALVSRGNFEIIYSEYNDSLTLGLSREGSKLNFKTNDKTIFEYNIERFLNNIEYIHKDYYLGVQVTDLTKTNFKVDFKL